MSKKSKKQRQRRRAIHQNRSKRSTAKVVTSQPQPDSVVFEQTEVSLEAFAGPLPHPDILAAYDKVHPGLADRIVSMAENQAGHRQSLEYVVVRGGSKREWAGLAAGWSIAISFLAGAVYLGSIGEPLLAAFIGGFDMLGIVYVFVLGEPRKKKELESRKDIAPVD